jgi:hypothetical protein
VYYRHPTLAISNQKQLVNYIVLDIEPIAGPSGHGGGGGYGQQQQGSGAGSR